MAQFTSEDDERRRSPRFRCSGRAMIRCLPSDGIVVPGRLRNLSLGGICVDINHPLDRGMRTELLVSVNAVSFRAVGLVRALQQGSRASMEFVQMSAGSKGTLAELVEQLAKFQAAMKKLRSSRLEAESEVRRELEEAGIRGATVSQISAIRRALVDGVSAEERVPQEPTEEEEPPLLIQVDLFG